MLKIHVLETLRIELFLSNKSEKVENDEETGSSDENHSGNPTKS